MTTATIIGGGTIRIAMLPSSPEVKLAQAAIASIYNGKPTNVITSMATLPDPDKFNVYNPNAVMGKSYNLDPNAEVLVVGPKSGSGTPGTVSPGITINGHAGTEILFGDASNDTINAAGGSGTIFAGNGRNVINVAGGGGPLDIVTGTNMDTVNMYGGVVTIQAFGKDTVNILSGANTVTSDSSLKINIDPTASATLLISGNDTISYGSGTDTVLQKGTATVMAASGGIRVTEGAGADTTKVGSLSATLMGGSGASSMVGGTSSNLFEGGGGHDTMVANKAATATNLFQFTNGVGGGYTIQNFVNGSHDHIHLVGYGSSNISDISSQSVVAGNLQVDLTDGTHLTLVGYTHLLTNSNFI